MSSLVSYFGNARYRSVTGKIVRIAARSSSRRIVLLTFGEVWAFEMRENQAFVHPNWLVCMKKVRQLRRNAGRLDLFIGERIVDESRGVFVPVAPGCSREMRRRLLGGAVGP